MNNYEVMYIINPTVEEEARTQLVERFSGIVTADGGSVEKIDDWGKRKLAYEIQDFTEGHYILMHFSAKPELPLELERNFKINENIIRFLTIRKDA
ncbi:30S ribosomal protein S6 [Eubacteriales bacterium OttesenSCG-928-M02]|nr:30S ribosomal protein S6 [Eubacteriales bacterium OttesenSCG-928-M02]